MLRIDWKVWIPILGIGFSAIEHNTYIWLDDIWIRYQKMCILIVWIVAICRVINW